MQLNLPGGSPELKQAIERFFRQVLSFPLRLWRVATADLPTATTDNEGGILYDITTNRPAYSDGSAWQSLMVHNAGAALTRTNDTNVTLTLGGSPATALLQATSLTLGWTGTLAAARGGTGVSALGNITRTNDTNVTLTLGGTPTGAVITSTSFTLGWTGTLAVSRGGTGTGTLTGILQGNGTSAFTAITIGGDLNFSGGTLNLASAVSTWSPTLSAGSGTLTTTTVNAARYRRYGQLVFFLLDVTIDNAGTGSSSLIFTLPINATQVYAFQGKEIALTGSQVSGQIASATTATVTKYDNNTIIATGNRVIVSGFYEA